jgi:hypothetical protein
LTLESYIVHTVLPHAQFCDSSVRYAIRFGDRLLNLETISPKPETDS